MPKRKNPDTSLAAYQQLHPDMISAHHVKIISALRLATKGMMYEQIAAHTKLDKTQVGRRTLELVKRGLVYITEEKRKTVSGRDAQVYDLTEAGWDYNIPAKDLPGKTISQYSKDIKSIQPTLF